MSERKSAEGGPEKEESEQEHAGERIVELGADAPTETLDEAIFYLSLWLREAQGLSNGPLVRLLKAARAEAEEERAAVVRGWREIKSATGG